MESKYKGKRKKAQKLTMAQKEMAIKLKSQNYSEEEIADQIGTTRGVVRGYIKNVKKAEKTIERTPPVLVNELTKQLEANEALGLQVDMGKIVVAFMNNVFTSDKLNEASGDVHMMSATKILEALLNSK